MKNTFSKSKIVSVATAATIVGIVSSHAAVVFSDTFTQNADTPLIGTSPTVGGAWAITGTSVVNPLTVSGALDNVTMAATGQDANGAFSAAVPKVDGNSLTLSALVEILTVSGAGDYFLHVSDTPGSTNFYGRIFARPGTVSGNYQVGVVSSGGTGATTTWGSDLAIGSPIRLELTWNFVAGTLNDTFSVAVTGAPNYIPATPWSGPVVEPTSIGAVNLRQGAAANGPTLRIDNVVVTSIPEPSTALLGAVGLLGLLRRRR